MGDRLRMGRVRTIASQLGSIAYLLLSSILRRLIHILCLHVILSSLRSHRRLRLITMLPIQRPKSGFMSDKVRSADATKVPTWLGQPGWTAGASGAAPYPGTWRIVSYKLVQPSATRFEAGPARRNRSMTRRLQRMPGTAAAPGRWQQRNSHLGFASQLLGGGRCHQKGGMLYSCKHVGLRNPRVQPTVRIADTQRCQVGTSGSLECSCCPLERGDPLKRHPRRKCSDSDALELVFPPNNCFPLQGSQNDPDRRLYELRTSWLGSGTYNVFWARPGGAWGRGA